MGAFVKYLLDKFEKEKASLIKDKSDAINELVEKNTKLVEKLQAEKYKLGKDVKELSVKLLQMRSTH